MEVMDMKQTEMSGYLKVITAGVGVLLAVFLFWFLPLVLKEPLTDRKSTRLNSSH